MSHLRPHSPSHPRSSRSSDANPAATSGTPEPARSLAAGLLNRFESTQRMLDELLAEEFSRRKESVTTARRFRAKTLVAETVRRRLTLDQILKVYSSRPPELMERQVRTALRMALAEWFFVEPLTMLDSRPWNAPNELGDVDDSTDPNEVSVFQTTPGIKPLAVDYDPGFHATFDVLDADADDESMPYPAHKGKAPHLTGAVPVPRGPIAAAAVRLVGHSRPSRGFVNGVLRAIDRDTVYLPTVTLARNQHPRDLIPAAVGGVYRFNHLLFADPVQKPVAWLSQFASLPRWLATRFVARYGLDVATDVAHASNATPALSIRVNTRKTTPATLRKSMEAAGIALHATAVPEVFRVFPRVPLVDSTWFKSGEIYLQDLTPARVGHAVDLKPGMSVLDACAAPGGKITHICERLNGKGKFVALDVSARRLELIKQNITRLGHSEIETVPADLRDYATSGAGPFDLIVLDAPCSNTGVMARRADARWRLTDEYQASLMKLQVELLHAAVKLLAPKGRIVYSTCTLEPEENRGIVSQIPTLKVLKDELWLPEPGLSDGGYICVLQHA